jgi:hypothetical protein
VRNLRSDEFIFGNKDAIVQYLFKPAPLSIVPTSQFGHNAISNAEWGKKLRTIVHGMLIGVPLREVVVSNIEAPFVGNRYAGEYLDYIGVSWRQCLL